MKKAVSLLIALLFALFSIIPACAVSEDADSVYSQNDYKPLLVDDADLLTSAEKRTISEKLDKLSQKEQMDVVIVTVTELDGKSPQSFADDFFDYNGYGYGENFDGILLLYKDDVPGQRDIYISTTGKAINKFQRYINPMLDDIIPHLSDGEYEKGFEVFIKSVDRYSGFYINFVLLIIALAIGILMAFVVMKSQVSSLKSVRKNFGGDRYITDVKLTQQADIFLFRNRSRIRHTSSSSGSSGRTRTHTGSSGRSHGGGGRRF